MCSGVAGLHRVVVLILMVPVFVHRHLSVPLFELTLLTLTTGTLGSVRCMCYMQSSVTGKTVGLDMLFAWPERTGLLAWTLTCTLISAPTRSSVLVLVLIVVCVTAATLAMPGDSPMTTGPEATPCRWLTRWRSVLGLALMSTLLRPMPG